MVNQCQCAVRAPVEDDWWGYVTNYNGLISECCRIHLWEGIHGDLWQNTMWHLVTMGGSARESVSQWHCADGLPLDGSQVADAKV